MLNRPHFLLAVSVLFLHTACNRPQPQESTAAMQSNFPAPPRAKIVPHTFNDFGHERADNYFWLKEKSNPEVIAYLEAENAYCDTVMKSPDLSLLVR